MDPQGRGARGKARGRAKPPTQGAPEAPRGPAGPPPGLGGPQPSTKPAAPAVSGRATHRGGGRPIDESVTGVQSKLGQISLSGNGSGNGSSGNGGPVGRGNMRGGRVIPDPITIRTRPQTLNTKNGISGQPIMIKANYFSLESKPDWRLNQYRVDYEPKIDDRRECFQLLRVHKAKTFGDYLFDGTLLYTSYNLESQFELFSQRESDGTQVKISLRRVSEVSLGDAQYLQLFNILTRRCLSLLDLQLIKRDYFDPKAKVNIPDYYLELWPGYKTTIRQHEKQVLMCAEITHKVLRTDNCFQLLRDLAQRDSRSYKTEFTRSVVGAVVLTEYNNKTYTITDVNWGETPRSRFDKKGTQVSFIDYYQQRYNIRVREENQPLLVSKSKPRDIRAKELQASSQPEGSADPKLILLIPELCKMTGLTDEMRSNFKLMRAMATHTRIGPAERIDRLMTMNRRLTREEKVRQEFTSWQLRLAEQLVNVPARILQPESIVLGNNKTVPSGDDCDWTRHLRSNPMFVMPQGGLARWVIMFPSRVGRDAEVFVDNLRKAGKGMSFMVAQPEYVELPNDRTPTYVEKLDQVISNYNPQLIFVVLLSSKADIYSAIKKKSLVDRAVPTQVLLAKNLNSMKGGMSIATKVAIQINCKIGGAPWSVQMPLGGLMVVGFDVCHDPKSKGKSFGAMVASLNKPMSRYFSSVSHHSTGEELSNSLAMNIVKAMQSYIKHNNSYPSHIMIYRDGVGDGQIPYVFNHEVNTIVGAISNLIGQTPKMAFVIVCKRINTRLFHDRNNPKPGTVVDDVITLPERYDFFIVSQYVNQGTVSPTSYNVIHDTLGLDPDKIQRLTFKLTHCYYNWSGTVRVPAPVQYAHKLAFLVSQSLHRPPNPSLEELLFFL